MIEESPRSNRQKRAIPVLGLSGIALLTVLALIIMLSFLAAALLNLQTNQVRFIAHDERRTRARYAEEAAMVRQLENLRKKWAPESSFLVDGVNVTVGYDMGGGINGTDELNLSHDYSFSL